MLALIKYPQPETEAISLFKDVLQQTYTQGRQQVKETVTVLGVFYERAGNYLSKNLCLPVNNFLKDLTQIEQELQLEYIKVDIAHQRDAGLYMEENY